MPTDQSTNNTHEHVSGRRIGIITSVDSLDRGFVFIRDEKNVEYFSHKSGWDAEIDFYDARQGVVVTFRATETTKGMRAWDVRRGSTQEQAEADRIADAIAAQQASGVRAEELGGNR